MPSRMIAEVLERCHVPFDTLDVTGLGTTTEADDEVRVRCVVLRVDSGFAIAVVRHGSHVDLEWFMDVAGANSVMLATPRDTEKLFPGCEAGFEPPFGLPVWVDEKVSRQSSIAFPAGRHGDVVRMSYTDFERIAQPMTARFARP